MKNLLTYISPDHGFNPEHQKLAKIQIDNSLALGWKPTQIVLITNFPYTYRGVTSIQVNDDCYCRFHFPATKIYTICKLFDLGYVDDTYWYHDFDCFQLAHIDDPLSPGIDMGLTNYGRMPRLCSASIFFRPNADDIFQVLKTLIDHTHRNEEVCMARLIARYPAMAQRIQHLNITYAMHRFNLRSCWKIAAHPLRAAHFHITPDKYAFYVEGKNPLRTPLIPQHLVEVFHTHGFTNA